MIDLTETSRYDSQEDIEIMHDDQNEVIEIEDNDDMEENIEIVGAEDEIIEIEDDEDHEMFNLTEHLGQHINESRTCEKCAKIGLFDDKTEEHLGNHTSCRKCESLN